MNMDSIYIKKSIYSNRVSDIILFWGWNVQIHHIFGTIELIIYLKYIRGPNARKTFRRGRDEGGKIKFSNFCPKNNFLGWVACFSIMLILNFWCGLNFNKILAWTCRFLHIFSLKSPKSSFLYRNVYFWKIRKYVIPEKLYDIATLV